MASAHQHPENQKESQAGHSPRSLSRSRCVGPSVVAVSVGSGTSDSDLGGPRSDWQWPLAFGFEAGACYWHGVGVGMCLVHYHHASGVGGWRLGHRREVAVCSRTFPSTARAPPCACWPGASAPMAGHDPWDFLWVLVWAGACYWHGGSGVVFNSPSPSKSCLFPLLEMHGIAVLTTPPTHKRVHGTADNTTIRHHDHNDNTAATRSKQGKRCPAPTLQSRQRHIRV